MQNPQEALITDNDILRDENLELKTKLIEAEQELDEALKLIKKYSDGVQLGDECYAQEFLKKREDEHGAEQ